MFFVLKGLSELIEEKCVFISAQSNHNNSAANPTTTTLSMYVGCVYLHISQQLWIAIVDLNKQRIPISGKDGNMIFVFEFYVVYSYLLVINSTCL